MGTQRSGLRTSGHQSAAWEFEDSKPRNSFGLVDHYADGEALLGWLNATLQIHSQPAIDAKHLLKALAASIQLRLRNVGAEVAHLKMTLSPDGSLAGEVAAVSLVRTDYIPELTLRLDAPVETGQFILNLRAEAAPDVLGTALRESMLDVSRTIPGLSTTLDHLEHFRPGKPTPSHRIVDLVAE